MFVAYTFRQTLLSCMTYRYLHWHAGPMFDNQDESDEGEVEM